MAPHAHGTLVATVVTTVTIDPGVSAVRVVNRSSTGDIYFTVDGSTPAVEGSTLPRGASGRHRWCRSIHRRSHPHDDGQAGHRRRWRLLRAVHGVMNPFSTRLAGFWVVAGGAASTHYQALESP